MVRYSPLLDTPEFRIGRFDHPPGDCHDDPSEEVNTCYEINRVERGTLIVEVEGRGWELGPGDLFLCYPGQVYRCRHLDSCPDDVCLSIAYCVGSDSGEQKEAFKGAAKKEPVLFATNRLSYLFRGVSGICSDQMAIEEILHSLVVEVVNYTTPARRAYSEQRLSWYAERVDAVVQQFSRNYAADHRLALLARSVGMSSFHFARIFRELVGMPPHACLLRIRLAEAAHRLRDGASVTETCYSTGFQNLSYFTRQFHRHFGASPSVYARRTRRWLRSQETFKK